MVRRGSFTEIRSGWRCVDRRMMQKYSVLKCHPPSYSVYTIHGGTCGVQYSKPASRTRPIVPTGETHTSLPRSDRGKVRFENLV
jgi:hypothetical protein